MKAIANQPVNFLNEILCNSCDEDIPQLSDNTDTVQVQFNIDNCGAAQLLQPFADHLTNEWYLDSGWNVTGGLLCYTGVAQFSAAHELITADYPAGYYQTAIDVYSFNGVGSVSVRIGNFTDGFVEIGVITGVGEFIFYSFITDTTDILQQNHLQFVPVGTGVGICFSSVKMYKILTDAKIAIYTEAGVYVTEIGYVDNPSLFQFYQNTVTVTIKWSDHSGTFWNGFVNLPVPIANGCYYLCFLDPCLNSGGQNYLAAISNQNFTGSAAGWILLGATYSANTVIVGDAMINGSLSQVNVFPAFINNCVKITVTAITGTLNVSFGTTIVATITTVGVHTICGVPVGTLTLDLGTAPGDFATIDTVAPVVVAPADYTCNLQSNTFKIGDYTNACTLLISAVNNENGLGFVFKKDAMGVQLFTPKIRLEAKIKGLKYPAERSVLEDSLGDKNVYYFAGRKAKTLAIDLQPEYVHDFLRLLIGVDNWYIDGFLYFVEDDEYSVIISEVHDSIGSVKLLVSTRTQNVKNFNCS